MRTRYTVGNIGYTYEDILHPTSYTVGNIGYTYEDILHPKSYTVGNIGYTYEDGVFVKKTVSDAALANDNGMLLWWEEACSVTQQYPCTLPVSEAAPC